MSVNKRPSPAQMARARRLLAHEGATGSADAGATTAAGRVHEKLQSHLGTLVGTAGVHLLFARSAKLAGHEFAHLAEVSGVDGSVMLRERLNARDPAVATESAATLFATFFTLTTTFIGERLTLQILLSTWPSFRDPDASEKNT